MRKRSPDKVSVNALTIRSNKIHDRHDPVIRVQRGRDIEYGFNVEILGPNGGVAAEVIYSPDKPLKCGARVWLNCPYGARVVPE